MYKLTQPKFMNECLGREDHVARRCGALTIENILSLLLDLYYTSPSFLFLYHKVVQLTVLVKIG